MQQKRAAKKQTEVKERLAAADAAWSSEVQEQAHCALSEAI